MLRFRLSLAGLALAVVVASAPSVNAGGPPYGIPSGVMPFEYQKYQSYKEPPASVQPRGPLPAMTYAPPAKYRLLITQIAVQHKAEDPNVVVLMAHLPEDALIWFEDTATKQTGTERWFESPPLVPGEQKYYDVRVVWFEDGKWVSQKTHVAVKAGEVHCIDIIPATDEAIAAKIAANLTKLSPEDRKLVEAQKRCPIQTDKLLGEMGVPVKIMVKGQPVFLCCKGCEKAAQKEPEKTLATIKDLKEHSDKSPPK